MVYYGISHFISKSASQKWNPLKFTKKDTLRFDSLNKVLIDSMNMNDSSHSIRK